MNTALFISWRYLVTKRKEKFLSLISVISVMGIAIGVMALIVVISVMTGFDNELRDRIVGNYSHINISSYSPIKDSDLESIEKKLKAVQHVSSLSPYILGQVVIQTDNRYMALSLKGIDPDKEDKVTKIDEYLVSGTLGSLKEGSVIIGRELALFLGLKPGSELDLYSPLGKTYKLKVSGVFYSGMYDYDFNLLIVDLRTAQKIFEMPGQVSSIALKLDNIYLADRIKEKILPLVGYEYNIKTWIESNRNFFAALKLEKLTMFIILTLIILVAAFNIISTLIVMVVEKTKDIGILKAMGMSSGEVRKIFSYEGLIIGSLGTLIGAAGGTALCLILKKYQFIKLPQDIYYIDRLPVALQLWPDIILVVSSAMAITFMSTIYPALRASRLEPVEALRYE